MQDATHLVSSRPVDLLVIEPKLRVVRCRLLGDQLEMSLRCSEAQSMVPGEILSVEVHSQMENSKGLVLSGDLLERRFDVGVLGLKPLGLRSAGLFDPAEELWFDEQQPREPWEQQMLERGPCPAFEMEQVLPGSAPDDLDDAILQAIEMRDGGDPVAARKLLVGLLVEDLRCLDAYAHLGAFWFPAWLFSAKQAYGIGVAIGELSLGLNFRALLPWGFVNNRPFLRCLHGLGLVHLERGEFELARKIFERLLAFNPADNQGVRFLINEASGQAGGVGGR